MLPFPPWVYFIAFHVLRLIHGDERFYKIYGPVLLLIAIVAFPPILLVLIPILLLFAVPTWILVRFWDRIEPLGKRLSDRCQEPIRRLAAWISALPGRGRASLHKYWEENQELRLTTIILLVGFTVLLPPLVLVWLVLGLRMSWRRLRAGPQERG